MPQFDQLIVPGLLVIMWITTGYQNSGLKKRLEQLINSENVCRLENEKKFGGLAADLGVVKNQQLNNIQKHNSHEQAIVRLHQRMDGLKSRLEGDGK